MPENKLLKATHPGELIIGDLILPCAVLEDGTRVLSERGVSKSLGKKRGGADYRRRENGGDYLPIYLSSKNLKPFISEELMVAVKDPIIYAPLHGGKAAYGLKAEVLPQICEVWLKARDAGALKGRQHQIAAMADILLRGLSRVGIIALIDEATGYQEERGKYELQQILKAYISEELLPWTTRFPMEFYKQMFKLWGWKFPPTNDKGAPRGPRYAGKLTKKLIYEQLPPGVIEKLEKLNPPDAKWQRKHKHSQFLTTDIGNPHLEKQVAIVTTLMKISPNKRIFEKHFVRAFPPAIPGPEKQGEFEFMKETEE